MSSIFVDSSKTFDVTVYWKQDGKRLVVLDEKPVGEEKVESVTVAFTFPDYQTERQIQRASITVDRNGTSVLDNLAMQSVTFQLLAKKWDLQDDKGEPILLNPDNTGKVHPVIMRGIITRMYIELAECGYV